MRKVIQVLLLLIVFSLGLSLPVWANVKWTQPLPPPSCYAGREYTRQHWVDFYYDEHGTSAYSVNRAHARPLFSGYCSVFDLLPDYNRGYTAVGDSDGVAWDAAMALDAIGTPNVGGWWIVSPSFWREKYGSAPQIFGGSELLSVPVRTVKDSTGLTLGFDTAGESRFGCALYRSTDGGETWKEIRWLIDNAYRISEEVTELYGLCFSPDGSLYLSGKLKDGNAPSLWVSRDNGNRWETVNGDEAPVCMKAVSGRLLGVFKQKVEQPSNPWAVPKFPSLLRASEDGGRSWPLYLKSGVLEDDNCLFALNKDTCFAVLDDYCLQVTNDGGKTWRDTGVRLSETPVPGAPYTPGKPTPTIKGSVVAVRDGEAVTVVACSPGVAAGVFVSRDGGVTWKQPDKAQSEWRPNYSASRAISVAAAPGGLIFAGTEDDCVLVSEDCGATWKPLTAGVTDAVLDLKCAQVGDGVVVFAVLPGELRRMEYHLEKPKEAEQQNQLVAPSKQAVRFVVGRSEYRVGDQAVAMDAAPFVANGRTYVPVRYLALALGVPEDKIIWSSSVKTVTLIKGDVTVVMAVGRNVFYINGTAKQMDVAPVIRNRRTYLPARYVAEAFGYQVSWDAATQTVNIS